MRYKEHNRKKQIQPTIQVLKDYLEQEEIYLNKNALNRLWNYHLLLRRLNKKYDLSRIHAFDSMVIKHYIDCLIVPLKVNLNAPLLDIGTGAGFPGLPIKIMNPNMDLILAEPRPPKIEFLKLAVEELQLKNVSYFPHRLNSKNFDTEVGTVITRALEPAETTLYRISNSLPVGGYCVFMKGPNIKEELSTIKNKFKFEYDLADIIEYKLLNSSKYQRSLIVLERKEIVDHSNKKQINKTA